MNKESIKNFDSELYNAIEQEKKRQEEHIELIASENYASPAVMEAQQSCFTNKYAEGYHGKRYYGGCENVDVAERLAIERAKSVFGAGYANVQPHSGSQANAAVYQACLEPSDTVLGMSLSHGGHLTHGSGVNFSGKLYNFVGYGITEDGRIDYNVVRKLAEEHKPKMIVAGFSAYSGVLDFAQFRNIADSVGAILMVDMAHVAGLVAAGAYPNPLEYADVVTTTTHKTLGGPRGGMILVKDDEVLAKKINSAVFPGIQGGPLMHVIAAKAIALKEASTEEFKIEQFKTIENAVVMCETLKKYGFDIVSNGTHNHLFLVDLRSKNITGKEAEKLLDKVNITVNKNSIPNDPESPFVTSGLRIGLPASTRRGFGIEEVEKVAEFISLAIDHRDNDEKLNEIKNSVIELCSRFPVYG